MAKKEEKTQAQQSENADPEAQPRRHPSTAMVLVIGALIGLGGLVVGGVGGYVFGRLQAQGRAETEVSVARQQRAFLGVGVLNIDEGALIHSLQPGGPAEEAGLMVGDIIVTFDGQTVGQRRPLESLVFAHQPGDEVEVDILRGGESETFEVTLGSAPADFGRQAAASAIPRPDAPTQPREPEAVRPERFTMMGPLLGVTVESADEGGLLVTEVLPASPAEDAGLLADDVILSANDAPVDTLEELRQQVDEAGVGGELRLEIRRDGEREEVVAEVGTRLSAEFLSEPGFAGPQAATLGVIASTFTPEQADDLDLSFEPGVLVVSVEPDTPAQDADLHEHDLITALDGDETQDVEALRQLLQTHQPGDVVQVKVLRDGTPLEVEVTLGARIGVPLPVDPELGTLVEPGFPAGSEAFISPPGCRPGDPLAPCL